jgi:Flp pilus assembly protein CpaB
MRLNPKMIFMISIVTAFVGFSLAVKVLNNPRMPGEKILAVSSARDINYGETLNPEDLLLIPLPTGINRGQIHESVDKVVGKIARKPIAAGQIIKITDILSQIDDVSGLIPEGYRASTIPIVLPKETMDSLKFGSRVDILFSRTSNTYNSEAQTETRTILKNVLVMKTISNQDKNANMPGQVQAYITLAVKPKAAETLAFALQKGKIDLLVHSMSDRNLAEEFLTLNDLLGSKSIDSTNPSQVEVIRGTKRDGMGL